MFTPAGINIETIPTDPRYQLNPDDQNTDLDKIVSHEGTPQSGDGAALYTYVANQEAKGGASPRRSSDGSAHNRRTKSAQNTPSPGSMAIHAEGQEHKLPIHQRQDSQTNPSVQTYAIQQQHASAQPRSQSFEQQNFTGGNTFRRQSINAMGAPNFVPLGTVPEGYQPQNPAAGMSYRTMPSATSGDIPNMDSFGDMSGVIGTEMDVDGMNLWWDQSYGTFDMEVVDSNANVGGEGYQFQNFSFGY